MPELEIIATMVVRDQTSRVPSRTRSQFCFLEDGGRRTYAMNTQLVKDSSANDATTDDKCIELTREIRWRLGRGAASTRASWRQRSKESRPANAPTAFEIGGANARSKQLAQHRL